MKQTNFKWYVLGTLALATALIWYAVYTAEARAFLTVAFLNVGQGDSIFLEAPNGSQIIVDGGPDDSLLAELGKIMPFYDKSIDMIVVTNPDKDHYAGFIDVMNQYDVGALLESGTHSETPTYALFQQTAKEHNIPELVAKKGMRFVLDAKHAIYLDILFPDQDVTNWKSNDGSTIAKLVYGETAVLLTGDATARTEEIVMRDFTQEELQSDILKIGHHGSKTSSGEAFIKAVDPELAVISAGYHNSYGLPKQEILDRLKSLTIPTLITYQEGTIIMQSDGTRFWRK